jgi:hypothetical protein
MMATEPCVAGPGMQGGGRQGAGGVGVGGIGMCGWGRGCPSLAGTARPAPSLTGHRQGGAACRARSPACRPARSRCKGRWLGAAKAARRAASAAAIVLLLHQHRRSAPVTIAEMVSSPCVAGARLPAWPGPTDACSRAAGAAGLAQRLLPPAAHAVRRLKGGPAAAWGCAARRTARRPHLRRRRRALPPPAAPRGGGSGRKKAAARARHSRPPRARLATASLAQAWHSRPGSASGGAGWRLRIGCKTAVSGTFI